MCFRRDKAREGGINSSTQWGEGRLWRSPACARAPRVLQVSVFPASCYPILSASSSANPQFGLVGDPCRSGSFMYKAAAVTWLVCSRRHDLKTSRREVFRLPRSRRERRRVTLAGWQGIVYSYMAGQVSASAGWRRWPRRFSQSSAEIRRDGLTRGL